LPLDGHHALRDRTRTAWRDQFQQVIVQRLRPGIPSSFPIS
jgi:hypothetical protein